MARILLIETSTALLSTAISEDGVVTACLESAELRSHASLTAVFIDRMLKKEGLGMKDFDAVAVSKGPGSYTGLRVGVSTAKGLCFGAGIPLIGIGTLEVLAAQAVLAFEGAGASTVASRPLPPTVSAGPSPLCGRGWPQVAAPAPSPAETAYRYIVPMIDARRMEVYCAVFSPDGKQLTNVEARIVEPDSFAKELSEGPVLFIGDGAEKCRETIPGGSFLQCYPKASAMAPLAEAAFKEGRFEDLAYFEPFYLKDFVATVSHKKLF